MSVKSIETIPMLNFMHVSIVSKAKKKNKKIVFYKNNSKSLNQTLPFNYEHDKSLFECIKNLLSSS